MLTRGTLPSRLELIALCGQQLTVPTEEIWRSLHRGNPGAVARLGHVYLPRLNLYLQTGLGVLDSDTRDAIIAETLKALAQVGDAELDSRTETSLYHQARIRAVSAGFGSDQEPFERAQPNWSESAIEHLVDCVRSTAVAAGGKDSSKQDNAIEFAARIACIAIATPVWFAESSFLVRISHARTIHEAIMDAAANYAPACLTPNEIQLRATEIVEAFDSVWHVFPPATREARILWGLNVDVPGIAKILDTSVAEADGALLQLLTITRVFDALIGRTRESDEREIATFSDIGILAEERE